MIKDDSCTAGEAPDWQEEWVGTNFRMWAAQEGNDQAEVPAYMLPVEIDLIINQYLILISAHPEMSFFSKIPTTVIKRGMTSL